MAPEVVRGGNLGHDIVSSSPLCTSKYSSLKIHHMIFSRNLNIYVTFFQKESKVYGEY